MAESTEHKFQVHLGGIIDLLSNHLYSSPHVYIRELLQNAVDAISARRALDPTEPPGEIHVEISGGARGTPPTLIFTDNGIGLTTDEVHRFLATIGESSKRGDLEEKREDFLGQFGIGLLSCFVVADEIAVITRSAKDNGGSPLEWRGQSTGTYTMRDSSGISSAGTQVYLRAKPGSEKFFEPDLIKDLIRKYGGLLPFPIRFSSGHHTINLNSDVPPWQRCFADHREEDTAMMEFGRELFDCEFMDWIRLRSISGGVDGVAYVLPRAVPLSAKSSHRVYLKNMLLSESVDNILPEWAFFVKCVVNTHRLRPTASRESFYEDDALEEARDELGDGLRDHLLELARSQPGRLEELISVHYRSIKALAAEDDDFYHFMIDFLPFETSAGLMTLRDYRAENDTVHYAPTVDQFRQIASIAQAHSLCVVNAGYVFDLELIQRLPEFFPDLQITLVEATDLVQSFEDLSLEESEAAYAFLEVADAALRPFSCHAELRKFLPSELPALYSTDRHADFLRSVDLSKDVADEHWSGVLDSVGGDDTALEEGAEICFNYTNPLVRRLTELGSSKTLKLAIEMLYAQALLLGHQPLRSTEMELLNHGLTGLIELAVMENEASS